MALANAARRRIDLTCSAQRDLVEAEGSTIFPAQAGPVQSFAKSPDV